MTDGKVTLAGETFKVADSIAQMAVLQHAKALDAEGDDRLRLLQVAQFDLLQQVIAPADWARFQKHAMNTRSSSDELWDVINEAVEVIIGRPTSRSADSSGGPTSTAPRSTRDSSSPASQEDDLEELFPDRPDLQVAVLRERRAKQAAAS